MPSFVNGAPSKTVWWRVADRLELWNRKIHYYLGLYLLFLVWLFALTGLLLNHPRWAFADFWPNRKQSAFERQIVRPPAGSDFIQAGNLLTQLGLAGEIEWTMPRRDSDHLDFRVSRPGRTFEIETDFSRRLARVRRTEVNAWGVMRILHTFTGVRIGDARNQRDWFLTALWAFAMDAVAAGLIVMVLGSYYMWLRLPHKRMGALSPWLLVCSRAGCLPLVCDGCSDPECGRSSESISAAHASERARHFSGSSCLPDPAAGGSLDSFPGGGVAVEGERERNVGGFITQLFEPARQQDRFTLHHLALHDHGVPPVWFEVAGNDAAALRLTGIEHIMCAGKLNEAVRHRLFLKLPGVRYIGIEDLEQVAPRQFGGYQVLIERAVTFDQVDDIHFAGRNRQAAVVHAVEDVCAKPATAAGIARKINRQKHSRMFRLPCQAGRC